MRKPEWPGITAAVGVLLLVAIAMDLSKWQPILAALVALTGGYMAYRGAMAKVEHDREVAEREVSRRQLAILLQTDQVLEMLFAQASEIHGYFSFPPDLGFDHEFSKSNFPIDDQPDLTEIWANLDLFPRKMIQEIYTIRRMLPLLRKTVDSLEANTIYFVNLDAFGKAPWSIIAETSDGIRDSCSVLMDGLRPLIAQLAPELAYNDRMVAIYGIPDDDD